MSYRSFKRVLGETSLERKCRSLFGICLLLLITGSFWWYGTMTEELVYKQNRTKGQLLVDTVLTHYHWQALESGEDYKSTVPSLSRNLQRQEYNWATITPKSPDPQKQPTDEFEARILRQFLRDAPLEQEGEEPPVEFVERHDPQRGEYVYYQAVRAKGSCIVCHQINAKLLGNPNLSEGDLISIVKVQIPDRTTRADLNRNRAILITTAIITVFLAMLAAYVIVRYVIVKPLKHLRDVSDAISHGDINSRAEIRTGDEFEELGVAFNRMLRHMVDAQDELREVNGNLDSKVDELAQLNMRLSR